MATGVKAIILRCKFYRKVICRLKVPSQNGFHLDGCRIFCRPPKTQRFIDVIITQLPKIVVCFVTKYTKREQTHFILSSEAARS